MDSFESLVAGLLESEVYWVSTGFKTKIIFIGDIILELIITHHRTRDNIFTFTPQTQYLANLT